MKTLLQVYKNQSTPATISESTARNVAGCPSFRWATCGAIGASQLNKCHSGTPQAETKSKGLHCTRMCCTSLSYTYNSIQRDTRQICSMSQQMTRHTIRCAMRCTTCLEHCDSPHCKKVPRTAYEANKNILECPPSPSPTMPSRYCTVP